MTEKFCFFLMEITPNKERNKRCSVTLTLYFVLHGLEVPALRSTDEADLHPEGRCSIAFLGGDGLHRSRHTLALPPSFL